MKDLKRSGLSRIEIFQDLTEREMAQMEQATTMTTSKAGRVFYAPEETGEALFLLKKGRVQLYRLSPEGKKLVVAVLEPGATFGEMSFIGQGMHNTFAEAIEDCTLCVMSRADVEHLILDKPKVALRILHSMARRLQEAEAMLEEVAFKSIPSRLAGLLLELRQPEPPANVVSGYTHQGFAEMLGTYRETITLVLNEFSNQGWIEIGRKQIVILDVSALVHQSES